MEAARSFPIFLLFVCFWRTSYAGSIKLCTDSLANFVKGTAIPTLLGKPLSVVFCVQCDSRHHIIQHVLLHSPNPNHPAYLLYSYQNNKDMWKPIIVNITSSANKAIVNITIKKVQEGDFTGHFSVVFYTSKGRSDFSVFYFNLCDAALLGPLQIKFTANFNRRAQVRSGGTLKLRCYVDGCPDRVTITRNEHPIAETTNYTFPFVHEITGVNCSHMGTYACLVKSPNGQDVQETAYVEVKGCPVSLCESEDTSREMSSILGENIAFSLCLISSEELKSSANETKTVVKFTRNPITRMYWTANITMNDIQAKDYRTHTVRIANSYGSLDVNFTLKDEDLSSSDASTIHVKVPAVTSITTSPASSSTELSTVSSQASPASTSTVSPTQEITQCWPHTTSLCPEKWYLVDNETCLLVTQVSYNASPKDVCNGHGAEPVKRNTIKKLRSCLINILQQSKSTPINYEVRLDNDVYVNLQTGANTSRWFNTHSVACFQKKDNFKPPTISLFKLQIHTETGTSLVDNITDYVTVNTTYSDVSLTCEAEGMPKPSVIITSESGDQFTSDTWIRLAGCSRAGVYTCTASNSLGTSRAHRRMHILSPLKVKFTANNNRRADMRSGDTVEFKCSVDGCPDRVTITRNEHLIAETTNYTIPLVHEITGVNCSHMGTYTCLAKSPTGQDVQETAELEVKGCRSNSTVEQKSKGNEFESNTLLIVLPPICSITLVVIIAGIVWYRVKGKFSVRSRAEETDASGISCADTKRAGHYENISPEMLPNAEYEEAAIVPYESIIQNTDDMEELSYAEYVEIYDVQYETPVKCKDRKMLTSHVHSSCSEAKYANTITYV